MILNGRHLTPTELILLHIQLETEDVRDDDTLRLVSIAVSEVAPATRPTPSQTPPAMDFDNDEGSLEDVAELVLGDMA